VVDLAVEEWDVREKRFRLLPVRLMVYYVMACVPGHTRHGSRWLTGALGTAAMAAARTKVTTFIGARCRLLAGRIGRLKALVAIEHTIITPP
jgi:hypothetical protein